MTGDTPPPALLYNSSQAQMPLLYPEVPSGSQIHTHDASCHPPSQISVLHPHQTPGAGKLSLQGSLHDLAQIGCSLNVSEEQMVDNNCSHFQLLSSTPSTRHALAHLILKTGASLQLTDGETEAQGSQPPAYSRGGGMMGEYQAVETDRRVKDVYLAPVPHHHLAFYSLYTESCSWVRILSKTALAQ